jgi:superfamily I DNA and RNA helicase
VRYRNIPKYRKDAFGKLLEPLTADMVRVALDAVVQTGPIADALLIDEGQDWEKNWAELLYKSVSEGGELLVAEDLTQDLYSRTNNFKGARFGVAPTKLDGPSLRLPAPVAEFASRFAGSHLDGDVDRPLTAPDRLTRDVVLNVHEVTDSQDFFEETVRVVLNAHRHLRTTLSISDIYLVCQSNRPLGVELVYQLKSLGLKVQHTFDGTRDDFWENEFPIKASTAHSIKGWESRAVIAVFPTLDYVSQKRALYVAMTRTLYHPDGSHLAVVTRSKEFARFARGCGFSTPSLAPLNRKPQSARTPGFDKV